jgi:hypothetical protein
MRKMLLGLAVCGLLLGGVGQASAGIQAYSTANTTGNQAFGGNLGDDFNVNQAITITQLGAFDSGQDGFVGTINVGLFQRLPGGNPNTDVTGVLLTSTTLTGTSGTLMGNYRFAALSTPITLQPGFYSVVAVGFSGSDLNGNENISGFTVTTNDGGGLISFVGTGRFDGNSVLDYPAQSSANQGFPGLTPHPFAGGSFEFQTAIPEPTSLTLTVVGILGLAGYTWRRRKQSA